MRIGTLVTTFNRPHFLERALPQIVAAAGESVLVVDDGSSPECAERNHELCANGGAYYLRLPENRGLAGAMNIGLSYWLCDTGVEFVSYLQDDVEVDPLLHEVMLFAHEHHGRSNYIVFTGHDAKEHAPTEGILLGFDDELRACRKASCRATHIFASRDAWASVMPIRSRGLGYPKRIAGRPQGLGSNADWWITRDAPEPLGVVCIPGLVRTFAWKAEDSCWANTQRAGEDAPLSRDAIAGWLERRSAA